MRYMFLVYSREAADTDPAALRAIGERHAEVMREAKERGVFCGADPLLPTQTATTVRSLDGKPITIDGPFAETKEQLAGYYILDCSTREDAIEWAKKIPTACKGNEGCIEVRPIFEYAPASSASGPDERH